MVVTIGIIVLLGSSGILWTERVSPKSICSHTSFIHMPDVVDFGDRTFGRKLGQAPL